MTFELLEKLQAALNQDDSLSESTKAQVLKHVAAIKSAADKNTAPDSGTSDLKDENHPLRGLVNSIEGLETSHPEVTALVNRIAIALGNMGI